MARAPQVDVGKSASVRKVQCERELCEKGASVVEVHEDTKMLANRRSRAVLGSTLKSSTSTAWPPMVECPTTSNGRRLASWKSRSRKFPHDGQPVQKEA